MALPVSILGIEDYSMAKFLDEYTQRNNSYTKKCIFNVGHGSGFFSEINFMIFAMTYCDREKIKFTLYSDNANFSNENGWEEFFIPFCEKNHHPLNKYNYRHLSRKGTFSRKVKSFRRRLQNVFVKKLIGTDYFTYDVFIWEDMKGFNSWEELLDSSKEYALCAWRFNEQTQKEVDLLCNELAMPKDYVGLHVRRGDKLALENLDTPTSKLYMDAVQKISQVKNIFVFCDDYRDFEELQSNYKDYTFYTFCKASEQGYFHHEYSARPWEERRADMIKLLANIEILRASKHTIGTWIANPSHFLAMVMPKDLFHFVEKV